MTDPLHPRPRNSAPPVVIFLGGIFTPDQTEMIVSESHGVVQNAADGLQKNIIRGLDANGVTITVVNLPFIASYPKGYKKTWFPPTSEVIFDRVEVHGQPFWMMRVVKSFSRFWNALTGIKRAAAEIPGPAVVLVYSAHLPFLSAALLHRVLFRRSKVCLVLPDFPEFMGEGGRLYTIFKTVESRIFYIVARYVDGFVVLTRFMAERLQLPPARYTVVEGIAEEPPRAGQAAANNDPHRRVFLYSGTLARRYGVMDLVNAFSTIANPAAELWICGDGDSRDRIVERAAQDRRIKFLGQVSREEARRLQSEATILVNPRLPLGEFTKYSFPSKTMEYMASGRPVIMHPLPGMPEEYWPHIVSPVSPDQAGLACAMQETAAWSLQSLEDFGAKARAFVLEEKGAEAQCRKIVDLISSLQ